MPETAPAPVRPLRWRLMIIAVVVGVLNTLVFLGFEWVVHHGTDYLWNDLVDSDEVRWRVVPLAIALSLAFSLLVRATPERRVVPPHTDPLGGDEATEPATPARIAVILAIGAGGLLAGASLGPEAPLVAVSAAIGSWLASRSELTQAARLLTLASVGALLVAFLGSPVPILIPLLLLYQREKGLTLATVLPPVAAGLAAYATLYAVQGNGDGWGTIPASTDFQLEDFLTALVLGGIGVGVAVILRSWLARAADLADRVDRTWHWAASASLFGAVLGGLYLLGGESVQFSGSEGVGMLLQDEAGEGALALAGLIAVKLLATAWSLAIGYRGGLIFPAVYAGVAMTLLVGTVAESLAGPGAMIGAVAGILAVMTKPVVALVMVVALLPAELTGLAVFGILGAVIAERAGPMLRARGQGGPARS